MLEQWQRYAVEREYLTAIQCAVCDRPYLLGQFWGFAQRLSLPLYFWNPAYPAIQQVQIEGDRLHLAPTALLAVETVIPFVVQLKQKGIFLLEGLLAEISPDRNFEIRNAHFDLQQSGVNQFVVLVDDYVEMPLNLYSLLPLLEVPLPSRHITQQQVAEALSGSMRFCTQSPDQQRSLVQACAGLPHGEIDLVLRRGMGAADSIEDLTEFVMGYKRQKLKGRGITLLPEPDVPVAAGLDLLYETLDKIRLLLQPEAEQRNLRPPKAVLLWGIPGSGKSLVAKLAAKHIGATLVACDWNGLVGATVRESIQNLDYLLNFVGQIGTTILFFDEFEKAFLGWDSAAEGGVLGKLAGRLLSWMQDHVEPVIMFATINRLEMLPPEMIRRFEYIHFFGMPHDGAMYEVFNVHLKQFFRYQFTENQWRILLREYRGCTPAEIGKAVRHVADRLFFKEMQRGQFSSDGLPWVKLEDLLQERQEFTPAASQRNISDQIAGILNRADYAKPVSGADTSIFARPAQTLMGIDEDAIRRVQRQPPSINLRQRPAVEDI